jgi:predicted acylesterase/phospholipase RssA
MKRTLDAHLLRGRTPPALPRILIHATSLPQTGPFVFTDETFEILGSRLDDYPLTHAVMASGAFPGAFHNVTLKDFGRDGYYQHLFDGGPSDNLGVHTLLTMIDSTMPRKTATLRAILAALLVPTQARCRHACSRGPGTFR